ncbi:MAG TPA: MFS transporter, partial [Bacteroidia bacterium]|nr:MFS transporter [Bacteroidia bacterium]
MGKFLPSGRDPYAALRIRDFSFFLTARFFLTLGVQVQSVTVGIQIYNLTKDPLAVGMIGLTEAVPFLLFSLIGGYIADIVRRKFILIIATAFLLIASWSLFIVSQDGGLIDRFGPDSYRVWPIYGIIFCTGIARGFLGPVFPSFLAQLVPRTHLANAATWQSNLFQTALVTGPIIAGLIIAGLDLNYAYFTACGLMSVAFLVMLMVSNLPVPPRLEKEPLARSLTSGFRFVFSNQIMLSAFTLDLFAVLFGGAVAMI